jgi:hypothetical protein
LAQAFDDADISPLTKSVVAACEQPSAKYAATASAFSSLILLFHSALPFTLAELALTGSTPQITDMVSPVGLEND